MQFIAQLRSKSPFSFKIQVNDRITEKILDFGVQTRGKKITYRKKPVSKSNNLQCGLLSYTYLQQTRHHFFMLPINDKFVCV